jgi:hypothetical protein
LAITRRWRLQLSRVKNERLVGEITSELAAAEEDSKASGQPARRFKEFSWSRRSRDLHRL